MKVGAIMRACRVRAGLSQEELADILYVNQSDISKYENDAKEPPVSLFQQWINNTQSAEVMVAFLCGMDGLGIMQNILDAGLTLVGSIIWGGI